MARGDLEAGTGYSGDHAALEHNNTTTTTTTTCINK